MTPVTRITTFYAGLLAFLFCLVPFLLVSVGPGVAEMNAALPATNYMPLIAALNSGVKSDCSVAVMPLGDSITLGYGDPQMLGYRKELFDALERAGYQINFVGSRKGGFVLDFDRDNEAHPGMEAYYIRDHMQEYLNQNQPDIILLHIGTNGLRNKSAEVVAQEIDQILTQIYDFDGDIVVFLARIINRVEAPELVQKTSRLNELLQDIGDRRIGAGEPLVVVDMESALIYSVTQNGQTILVDMYDALHPNVAGYRKMAAVWDTALQAHLSDHCLTDHPAKLTSSPSNEAFVGVPYLYRAEASGNPAPSFALAQSPPGMTIDPASGQIVWTPVSTGSFNVRVKASNGVGVAAEQAFVVHVADDSVCPSKMSAFYRLEEPSAPFASAVGGTPAQCSNCPASVTGKVSQGLGFDGTGHALTVAATDGRFDWGRWDDFSIEFWLRRPDSCAGNSADYNEVVVGRVDSSTSLAWWVGVSCQHQGKARFVLRDSDSDNSDLVDVVSWTSLTDGNWHHVAVVRDWPALDARVYVDGRLEGAAQAIFSSALASDTAALNIGWFNLAGGFHLQGTIDELAIYDRTLTDGEISRHYALGLQGKAYCRVENLSR